MEWPAGLTNSDKEWLLDNLELATSDLEEDVDGTTVQEAQVRDVQEDVSAHWPTWDGVSELPRWLREGFRYPEEEQYRVWFRQYQVHYSTSNINPRAFEWCTNAGKQLTEYEERARERFWSQAAGGEPELRGVYELQPSVRQRKVVRQSSKQRKMRDWGGPGSGRYDVVR